MKNTIPKADLEAYQQEMLALVGKAISRWASVENGMSELFSPAVDSRNNESAFYAMNAIKGAETMIVVIDGAMKWTFRKGEKHSDHVLPARKILHKELDTGRKLRAKIAHCQVVMQSSGEVGRIMMLPHYAVGHRRGIKTADKWNCARLENAGSFYAAVSWKLNKLANWLTFFSEHKLFPDLPPLQTNPAGALPFGP